MAEEDILWGKHRHLFGGIQPSNLSNFTAVWDDTVHKVRLNFTVPGDTIINGQTVCSYEGTIFRYKLGAYPKDEFDGELLADVKGVVDTVLVDGLTATESYFISAYPYSTQGVYNRNEINRVIYNEPVNLDSFEVNGQSPPGSYLRATISLLIPESLYGVMIRKSTIDYPKTPEEGTWVADITRKTYETIYEDTNVELNAVYYYSAFPYVKSGERIIYNMNYAENCASDLIVNRTYYYGYDLDLNDPDPDTRVTYPEDVNNASYASAGLTGTDTFTYGDWSLEPGEHFMPRPCMLKYDGVVDYYLDPNNYKKCANGITDSDVTKLSYAGNAMMEWPKIYTKRETVDGIYKFRCSDVKIDDTWDCWCNYDKNNNEIDHFYTSIYRGTSYQSGSKVIYRSLSGQTWDHKESFTESVTGCQNIGDGWNIALAADHFLIQDLFVMMFKNTDSQKVLGKGNTNSYNRNNGVMDTAGLFKGSTSTSDNVEVKVFGMENLWGSMCYWLNGLWLRTISGGKQYAIKITRGTHDGSTVSDYSSLANTSSTNDGYIEISYVSNNDTTTLSRANILFNSINPYGRLPQAYKDETNGTMTTTTYECDYTYLSPTNVNIPAVVSGDIATDEGSRARCGLFYLQFMHSAGNTSDKSTFISYKPTAQV